jgi:hypothetical protein
VGFYSVLQLAPLRRDVIPIGVLIYDPAQNRLLTRFRTDWSEIDEENIEVLQQLADDLRDKSAEMGPLKLLAHLEDTLSNIILISERQDFPADSDPEVEIDRLFARHVESGRS